MNKRTGIGRSVFDFIQYIQANMGKEISENTKLLEISQSPAGMVLQVEYHFGRFANLGEIPVQDLTVGQLIDGIVHSKEKTGAA